MRILICSDSSEQADQAIRLGAEIAAGCRAEVTLLGIVEMPEHAGTILESLRRGQAVLADKGIRAEIITQTGEPIQEIRKRTELSRYELVVIGAVRKTAFGPFRMSSKAYRIIKGIRPPVLSVTGKCPAIHRMLICSAGGRHLDEAVNLTGQIARGTGASITLLHVMPEPPAIYARLRRMEETTAWLLNSPSELGVNLRHEKEALAALGVPTEVRLRQGSVLEEILREIHQGNYDLVATGSALSRSLRTYVLGDISREIINHAVCAVLVLRSDPQSIAARLGFRKWFSRGTRPQNS